MSAASIAVPARNIDGIDEGGGESLGAFPSFHAIASVITITESMRLRSSKGTSIFQEGTQLSDMLSGL